MIDAFILICGHNTEAVLPIPGIWHREITPLAKLRVLEEFNVVLKSANSREALSASFGRAAQRAAEEDNELDGETLPAALALEFLAKK